MVTGDDTWPENDRVNGFGMSLLGRAAVPG